MKWLIIETRVFTRQVTRCFRDDEEYSEFQAFLANHPDGGSPIPRCGPLRKLRWGQSKRGKGKRGGLRVIYMIVPEVREVYLLLAYGKDEQDNLSRDTEKELTRLARGIKEDRLARERKEP